MLYNIILLFLMTGKAVQTKQNGSGLKTSFRTHEDKEDEMVKLCGYNSENCVESFFYRNSLSSWTVISEWMNICINVSTPFCGNVTVGDNVQNDGMLKDYNDYKYLLLNLKEIEAVLAAIQSFIGISKYFFDVMNCSKETIAFSNKGIPNSECYDPRYLRFVQRNSNELPELYNDAMGVYIFQKYIEVTISLVVMALGLVMDGTLLFIFIKHREIISEGNMIILNIAICDFVAITVVFPIQYLMVNGIYYSEELRIFYAIMMIILSSTSALSILSLSIQRLMVMSGCLQGPCCSKINKYFRVCLFILFVWGTSIAMLAFLYTLPLYFASDSTLIIFLAFGVSMVLFFLVLLPIIVTVINVVTSCKLRRSANQIPGENIHQNRVDARYRSSRVITFLCIVFWVTHAPVMLLSLVIFTNLDATDISFLTMKYLSFGVHSLFCLNAFLNPLAQVIMSKQFRERFMKYLLRR